MKAGRIITDQDLEQQRNKIAANSAADKSFEVLADDPIQVDFENRNNRKTETILKKDEIKYNTYSPKEISDWARPETWPEPSWIREQKNGMRKLGYKNHFAYQLRSRYIELEGEFRTIFPNYKDYSKLDIPTVGQIVDALKKSREILEEVDPDIILASNLLDEAEEYLVWIVPDHLLKARIPSLSNRLSNLDDSFKDQYVDKLDKIQNANAINSYDRAIIDEILKLNNKNILNEIINNGLQIERLRAFRSGGCIIAIILIVLYPIIISYDALGKWPHLGIFNNALIDAWLVGLSIAALGCSGGFLSSLHRVRKEKTNLLLYEESMLLLQLKPIVGSIAALVLCLILSWNALSGVLNSNPGSYTLVAFVSGFSERYFLSLLKIEPIDEEIDKKNKDQNSF